MTKAVVIQSTGGPDVLHWQEIAVGEPGPGEVRLKHSAAAVNFIDIYHRKGLYKVPGVGKYGLPPSAFIPGLDGVGRITAIGSDVTGFKVGDRVAYGNGPLGAYAEERLIPATSLVPVPKELDDKEVAGLMLRGLTVWYLIYSLHMLKPNETVLFHAAAGGVGLLFCQWARHIGATVIGTVGSEDKAAAAKAAGCAHTILYKQEDWVAKVRALTDGKGVPVVYDGVGKDTFAGSLDCLAPRGILVSFGSASGPAPAFEVSSLAAKGSLFVTRPRLDDYMKPHSEYLRATKALFDIAKTGVVKAGTIQSYPLKDAARAHADLEGRKTTGSTILTMA